MDAHHKHLTELSQSQQEFYIVSQAGFPVMLRLAGQPNPVWTAGGFGTVNCQGVDPNRPDANVWERYKLVPSFGPGPQNWSFESINFPGCLLRADPNGQTPTANGFGVVNVQSVNNAPKSYDGSHERFDLVLQGQNPVSEKGLLVAIRAPQLGDCYLRMDSGARHDLTPPGFGTVNLANAVGPMETFYLSGTWPGRFAPG